MILCIINGTFTKYYISISYLRCIILKDNDGASSSSSSCSSQASPDIVSVATTASSSVKQSRSSATTSSSSSSALGVLGGIGLSNLNSASSLLDPLHQQLQLAKEAGMLDNSNVNNGLVGLMSSNSNSLLGSMSGNMGYNSTSSNGNNSGLQQHFNQQQHSHLHSHQPVLTSLIQAQLNNNSSTGSRTPTNAGFFRQQQQHGDSTSASPSPPPSANLNQGSNFNAVNSISAQFNNFKQQQLNQGQLQQKNNLISPSNRSNNSDLQIKIPSYNNNTQRLNANLNSQSSSYPIGSPLSSLLNNQSQMNTLNKQHFSSSNNG